MRKFIAVLLLTGLAWSFGAVAQSPTAPLATFPNEQQAQRRTGLMVPPVSCWRREPRQWSAAMDAEDKAHVLREAEAVQEQVDAIISLVHVITCANAKGNFARAMCE